MALDNNLIRAYAARIEGHMGDAKAASSEAGEEATAFKGSGGNPTALRLAIRLKGMEGPKGQQFFRDLEAYVDALGLFDQGDIIEMAARAA